MANAQQPTRRTKHMDLKHFALLDWVERDLLILRRIKSSDNFTDSLTKPVGKELHYRHNDYLLGKIMPKYVSMVKYPSVETKNVASNHNTYKSSAL